MKHVVFDLGNVLIDWVPERAFDTHFSDDQATRDWINQIDFATWNQQQDAGRSFAEALTAAQRDHGALAAPLHDYLPRFGQTITRAIPGSWEIAETLAERGHRMFAITNWAAETWPVACEVYPRLTTIFEDVVVSGEEKLTKPGAAIYQRLLDRNGLQAGDCIFIDDSAANVAGARAVGMTAIHFTDAADLEQQLAQLGLA